MIDAKLIFVASAACLALTGCDRHDDGKQGTTVTVNAKDDDGSDVAIKADGATGRIAMDVGGFKANVKLPKMMLDESDFDIDGVDLYPGSKVATVDVNADERGGSDRAMIKVGFTSPADPATVRKWFMKAFADKSRTVAATAQGLSGKTEDGDDFTMAFAPAGAGQTSGTVTIEDKGR